MKLLGTAALVALRFFVYSLGGIALGYAIVYTGYALYMLVRVLG